MLSEIPQIWKMNGPILSRLITDTYYLPTPGRYCSELPVAAVLYYYVNEINRSCTWILFCKSKEESLNNKILKVQVTLTIKLA